MTRTAFSVAATLALMLALGTSGADAQTRTEVGTLTCSMAPTVGALVGSRRRMTCRFDFDGGQRSENYTGTVTRFGVDVGALAGGFMSWRVFSRTRPAKRGSIAGNYFGVSGDVSMGLGGGVKVLIGGSRRSTMLQPISLVGNVGLNIAVGVTGLTLRHSR